MAQVRNTSDMLMTLEIINAAGTIDGVHIQPRGKIDLPPGFTVTGNSLARNPAAVADADAVTQVAPAPAIVTKQTGASSSSQV